MQNDFIVVSIEGNIGSGKSTLLANLRDHYRDEVSIVFLKEPVDEWEKIKDSNGVTILEKFYADQTKYSFAFQMMAYISRLKVLRDSLKATKKTDEKIIFITERSLYTDKLVFAKMLFDSGKMEDTMYQIYLNWFDTFSDEFPVNKVIYVKADANVCHQRIAKRSRDGEGNIPLSYLENCSIYHDNMLNEFISKHICTNQLILNGNVDIYENNKQLETWISNIDRFIYN
jgi:deoxyadenosine/deoxycytidine kinase